MDPYLNAISPRGEGFRCDDIQDLDQFAAEEDRIRQALAANAHPAKSGLFSQVKNWFSKLILKESRWI